MTGQIVMTGSQSQPEFRLKTQATGSNAWLLEVRAVPATVRYDRTGAVGKFFVILVSDVENGAHCEC
jgi:hypothetical protein